MRPLIGVTTSLAEGDPARPARVILNAAYVRAVEHAGGVPVLLSPYHSLETTRELLAAVAGVVLTGGGDVDPARYGEVAEATVGGVSGLRDSYEASVIGLAMARELPLLLICRGLQVFNVAMGGSLVQDIAITGPEHQQDAARTEVTHSVRVAPGSRLGAIVRAETIGTNSMHHQAVNRAGRGVCPVAWAEDGVVEGIEMPGYSGWLVGVQWHPEELSPHDPGACALFQAFLQAACPAGG